MTQPSEAENGGWVVDPPKPAEEKSAKVIAEKKAEGEGDGEPVLVKDGYVKANHVLWDWPNLLSAWQRNAVMGLVKADALCHPDNPLYSQEKKGIELYVCTDSSGKETPCFSLKQLQYIQYYIHENRMADPAWIAHLAKINTATKAEREAGTVPKMDDAGPTEYPSGQEWVNLPDAIRPAEEFEHIEPIVFNDPSALKKYLNKMAKIAKQKEAIKMVAMAPEDRPELDDEMAALVDNATPGPGLRRGPGKSHDRRPPVFRWDGGEDAPATDSQTGWGGFPLEQADEPVADAAPISQEEDFANRTRALIEDILPQATQTPPDEVEEEGQDGEASEQPTTFSEQYFSQSQHALMYASVGGLFAANRAKDQSASLDKIAELAAAPPIGRGLFISINVTTWDEDNSVILDVGWSAIWWQFGVENKDEVEEMRDGGHFIVQDHVLGKHNGKVRPDKRSDFLYGNSLPIPLSAFNNTIDTTIKALQNRAGGGTTYLVYHSNDQEYSDLEKIGIKTKDWYRQLKPSGWDYPAYACADGIGNVFVIDTAILFAAIEFDTTAPPVPVKTKKSLLEIVTLTASGFGNDVTSVGWGNSGNDAFNNLQMFLSMMTDHTLETWRLIYNMSQLASSFGLTDADAPTDVEDEQEEPNGDKAKITAEAEANDDDVDADAESVYSEDEMMAGVYYDGDDGDLVKLDDEDDVGPKH